MRRFTYWDSELRGNRHSSGNPYSSFIEFDYFDGAWSTVTDQKIIDIIEPLYNLGKITNQYDEFGWLFVTLDDDLNFKQFNGSL